MFPSLEPLRIGGPVIFEKEARRGGGFEEVVVERGSDSLFMAEYGRCRAPDRGHVRVVKLDKLHQLADKSLHVGSRMIAWLVAHAFPPPATACAEGRQFNGAPFPATASAEGAQLN